MASTDAQIVIPNYSAVYGGSSGGSGGSGTQPLLPGTPRFTHVSTTTLVAGASTTLDSAQVTDGSTARLVKVTIASSVGFEATLNSVLDTVLTPIGALRNSLGGTEHFEVPNHNFITVTGNPGALFDGFNAVVTNCDNAETGNVDVTFFWLES